MDTEPALPLDHNGGKGPLEIGSELVREVEQMLTSGRMTKLRVKLAGRTVKEVPLAVSALGALLLASAVVVLSNVSLEVESE